VAIFTFNVGILAVFNFLHFFSRLGVFNGFGIGVTAVLPGITIHCSTLVAQGVFWSAVFLVNILLCYAIDFATMNPVAVDAAFSRYLYLMSLGIYVFGCAPTLVASCLAVVKGFKGYLQVQKVRQVTKAIGNLDFEAPVIVKLRTANRETLSELEYYLQLIVQHVIDFKAYLPRVVCVLFLKRVSLTYMLH